MTEGSKSYLFVYGTLRKVLEHPLHEVLTIYGEFVGDAIMPGCLYDAGDYPAAVPAPDGTEVIHGELYYLREPQRILDKLDRYEGCITPEARRAEYRREYFDVRLYTGDRVKAWVYLYNLPTEQLTQIPSGDYLQWLDKGNGRKRKASMESD
ncbi:MAG: gamma-glutamylcyclotransferase family protein [Gammaproteobacteria bacterium]